MAKHAGQRGLRRWIIAILASVSVASLLASASPDTRTSGGTTMLTVSVTSPTAGATVAGSTELRANAPGAAVVTWYVDQVPVASDTSAEWRQTWDSASVPNAQHEIYAVAGNGAGGVARSTTVTFTVRNGSAASSSSAESPVPLPAGQSAKPAPGGVSNRPPPRGGYFSLQPVGSWASLGGDATCAAQVHRSTWEPRPDNTKRNHVMPDAAAVRRSFAARPVATAGTYDSRWGSWLLRRVDGQFTGTTDEIFQWAACKWGLPDDTLRAVAVRESTWYQYETYPTGRPVIDWGSGDMMPADTTGADVYCAEIARFGHDYRRDFDARTCPRTFSIVGVMSWQDPSWDALPGNQNGTFPFNRDSTGFAVDYLGSQLRGCYEGWEVWLRTTGTGMYAAGDIWGCVGAWYAGDWHSSSANGYISRVRTELANFTWLDADWPTIKPSCDPVYGCPGPGRS
jgi:hypothetical protein